MQIKGAPKGTPLFIVLEKAVRMNNVSSIYIQIAQFWVFEHHRALNYIVAVHCPQLIYRAVKPLLLFVICYIREHIELFVARYKVRYRNAEYSDVLVSRIYFLEQLKSKFCYIVHIVFGVRQFFLLLIAE